MRTPTKKIGETANRRTDVAVGFSLALYIFFSFMSVTPFLRDYFGRGSLYAFLGFAYLGMIRNLSSLRLSSYSKWYFFFCALGLLSFFYAWNNTYVLDAAYLLFVNLLLTYAIIHYARSHATIVSVVIFYAYSALSLTLYLFISGKIHTEGNRLGSDLYGNANILGTIMMLALISVFWLILCGNSKLRFPHMLIAVILFYVTALTGGMKYVIVPFIFLLLLIILKNARQNRFKALCFAIIFLLIPYAGTLAIFNVPALYRIIGLRFAGLMNFLAGNLGESDYSVLVRYMMITKGWDYFLANPILGYGLDNYRYLFASDWQNVYSHNNYIELLVNFGFIGFLLYYSFYVFLIRRLLLIKEDKSGLRDFFLAFILSLTIFEIGAITYSLTQVQIFIGLASAFLCLNNQVDSGRREEQASTLLVSPNRIDVVTS